MSEFPMLSTLRRTRSIARWMLVCFALSLGVAVASPLVRPQALELICSAAGVTRLVAHAGEGVRESGAGSDAGVGLMSGSGAGGMSGDCPLCPAGAAPPPVAAIGMATFDAPAGHGPRAIPTLRRAVASAAPLPARG